MEEIGTLLPEDRSENIPVSPLYWNLSGAVFEYAYVELAKMDIDVATLSGIYDRPHGLPGPNETISFIDPTTGALRAPIRVLQLIKNNFGPGDELVSTGPTVGRFSLIDGSDVAMQAFVTPKGKRLFLVNKRLHEADIDLTGTGSIVDIKVLDEQSEEGSPRAVKPNGNILHMGPFAVAVVSLQ